MNADRWPTWLLIASSALIAYPAQLAAQDAVPTIVTTFFYETPVEGDTYGQGETIGYLVVFDKDVQVTGEPRLELDVGGVPRQATYRFPDDDPRLLFFGYRVEAGDLDSDGVSAPAGAVDPAGGSITLAGSSVAAVLTHAGSSGGRNRKVDGSRIEAPALRSLLFLSSPADAAAYSVGEIIWVQVYFNRAVQVIGAPRLELDVGGNERQATYRGVFHDHWLLFGYVVQPGDSDDDGVGIPADALDPAGGSINLAGSSTTGAVLTHDAVADAADHQVDGTVIEPPAVDEVLIYGSPANGDTYGAGERILFRVHFDRAVEVTGDPQLEVTIGNTPRQAAFDQNFNWQWLYFGYVVRAGDSDSDGVGVPADALELAGGSITLAGVSTTAALLTHDAVPDAAGHKVDGSVSPPPPPPPPLPPPPPPNRGPETVGTLPDRMLEVGGAPLAVEAGPAFRDADGDELTYTAVSSAPAVVTAAAVGSTATLVPLDAGAATVTVTATDADGSNRSATQTFSVTVACAFTVAPLHRDVLWPAGTGAVTVTTGSTCGWAAASESGFLTVTAGASGTGPGAVIWAVAANGGGPRTGSLLAAGERVTVFQASPTVFTDPIERGPRPVKAIHFLELRARIDALREDAGLSAFGWTDATLTPGVTPVRRVHLTELREALDAVYADRGRTVPAWADPAPEAGATPIRSLHLTELRAAVADLE